MKAFLLAAGLGTRLRPLTERTPKCLLPIGGRPILDIWLDTLAGAGVEEVLVNLHHLAEQVERCVAARAGGPRVRLSHEPTLLGSAGTLAANRAFVEGEPFFLACYADNLTSFDLSEIVVRHRQRPGIATLVLCPTEKPREVGIAELDADEVLVSFEEKPARPRSGLANAGIYAFSPEAIDLIDQPPPADIAYNLLPHLVGRARGLVTDAYVRDIGTLESYRAAQREWSGRLSA